MLKNHNFIERSIAGALAFLKESVFSDEYASKNGFLQSLDPRIKTATFLLLVVQVLLAKKIVVLLFLYAISILLACLSKIRLGFFLKRTWVFIPLFSLFIALPAVFSIFTPGETLAVLKIAGLKLIVTRQGLFGAALFVTRVITSVSLVVLLSITTKHFELLKVLRIFKVPQVFVMTFGMCYRYIFLFVGIIENTYLAVKSRVGTKVRSKRGRRIVAFNIASLWQRSYRLNEDVYRAMLSRGYNGEPLLLNQFKAGPTDWLWLLCALTIFITVR
jgi:cobalt/nickel transport system permease protein